jgi:hypothetical protein
LEVEQYQQEMKRTASDITNKPENLTFFLRQFISTFDKLLLGRY